MSSPESALFLYDIYDNNYFPGIISGDKIAFGSVLYRDEEDPYLHTSLKEILNQYTRADIKKFFGYTLAEYLDLSLFEASLLLEQSEKMKEELSKVMNNVKKDVINNTRANRDNFDGFELNPLSLDEEDDILGGGL